MKLKRHSRKLVRNEKGIVGIGTLIVFIAMVLVAAIAAAVIINTAAQLQQQAQRAGEDTAHDIGIGILVKSLQGRVNTVAGVKYVDQLRIMFELNPGAKSMDLTSVLLQVVTTGAPTDVNVNLIHSYANDPTINWATDYGVYDEGDTPSSIDPNNAYVSPNGPYYLDQDAILVCAVRLISIGVTPNGMDVGSLGLIKFVPAGGGSVGIEEFRVPVIPTGAGWVELY